MLKVFRILGFVGAVLLGAALAIAPVAAFDNRMTVVSALGIAGIVFLLVAWLARRLAPALPEPPEPPQPPDPPEPPQPR